MPARLPLCQHGRLRSCSCGASVCYMPPCQLAKAPLLPVMFAQGYRLSDKRDHSEAWAFPSGVSIAPGQYLLVGGAAAGGVDPAGGSGLVVVACGLLAQAAGQSRIWVCINQTREVLRRLEPQGRFLSAPPACQPTLCSAAPSPGVCIRQEPLQRLRPAAHRLQAVGG